MVSAFAALIASCHKPECPAGSVLIPEGTFEMGTKREIFPAWQLKPRKVTLTRPYCMDRTEVTHGAYDPCVDAGVCKQSPSGLPTPPSWVKWPKDFIDWEDALVFCKWKGGRLPTEAEWEFAARGTDGRLYPWGNEAPTSKHWRWPHVRGKDEVVDVGSFPRGRSAFGLDDMSGNVKEWVADECGLHEQKADVDPVKPDILFKDPDFACHIVRGGAWSAVEEDWAAATFRQYGNVGADSQTGFRCAYDPK
jgi:eukaryotic-like serine/threonine-protein kinase